MYNICLNVIAVSFGCSSYFVKDDCDSGPSWFGLSFAASVVKGYIYNKLKA